MIKSKEEILKQTFEHHKAVVKPDSEWAEWERCVEDGTVAMVIDAMEAYHSQFPSQGLREEEKSKVKDLIRDAWGASALAHRLYPENKHTFSDYWHTLDKKEFESLFTSTKDNQL